MRTKAFFPVAGAVFGAISPTCTGFLSPGAPRVRITNVVRRPSKLSHQHPYHHERAPRWTKYRNFKSAFEHRSAAAEDSTADNGGEAEAVRQEVGRIREARLRAGQIKAELDALEVSYAGFLEKSEFEQALAEARVASSGQGADQAPAAEDAEDDEVTTFSDPRQQPDQGLKQEPRSEELGEEGESSVGGLDSEDAETSSSEPKREPATKSFTQPESVEEPQAEPEPKQESHQEQPSRGPAPEVESVTEPAPASEPVTGEPVPEPVSVEESPVSRETSSSIPEVGKEEGQSSDSVDPGSGVVSSDIDEEISRIREARMTAGQIKAELDSMDISYIGLLEKAEFVKKLAEARTNPAATGARDGSCESSVGEGNVGLGEEAAAEGPVNAGAASVDPQTSGEGMRSSEDAAADVAVDDEEDATIPPPPPSRPMGEETSGEPTRIDVDEESEPRSDEGKARSTVDREEVLAMRVSQIKQELDERGVTYRGLLEKSEFVDLLIDARERGITAPPTASAEVGGGNAEATGSEGDDAETRTDGFDPSYKEVETKKMKRDTDGRPGGGGGESAGPGGMPGSMPAGAGFDIGSILGAMGGMGGGGGNAGSPGVPGGVDIGSILGAMGGQPPSERGSSSGGAASGMGDILGKLMNNPKAQAVFQKAQSNPKVMAAIQDVSQNGLGAMAKYSNDPEIRDVIEDLKSLF